jgi:hypothetical protein
MSYDSGGAGQKSTSIKWNPIAKAENHVREIGEGGVNKDSDKDGALSRWTY